MLLKNLPKFCRNVAYSRGSKQKRRHSPLSQKLLKCFNIFAFHVCKGTASNMFLIFKTKFERIKGLSGFENPFEFVLKIENILETVPKGENTLQKIFHGTEDFPRTACAVRFFRKKKSYCACGSRKIFRSVENFLKCICTLMNTFKPLLEWKKEDIPLAESDVFVTFGQCNVFLFFFTPTFSIYWC